MQAGFRNAARWFAVAAVAGAMVTQAVAQIGRRPARPQVDRPDGPVWQVIRANCTACHGIDDYAFYSLDRAGWEDLIAGKHPDGSADLAPADQNLLLDYLVEEFGPDSKAFPREYIPPEITEFFSDPEAFRLLDRACSTCHSSDRIDDVRYPLERWRAVAVDMRERGAVLSDEELEQLVEWLGRVRGTNQGN